MEKVLERLEQLEAQWVVLNEENSANKATIQILEEKLSKAEQRFEEFTTGRQTTSSDNAPDVTNDKRLRVLEKKFVKQQLKIQEACDKLGKVDKLQQLLNYTIVTKATAHDKIQQMSSRLDSMSDAVDDLQANTGRTSSQMDGLNSMCTSMEKDFKDLQASAGRTSSQTNKLNSKCTIILNELKDWRSSKPSPEETQQARAFSAATAEKIKEAQVEKKFYLYMERIHDHGVPLSTDDFLTLAALELMIKLHQGPAYRFAETVWHHRTHMKRENKSVSVQYILAVDQLCVRFLSPATKSEIHSWPFTQIDKCEVKKTSEDSIFDYIELELKSGKQIQFETYEKINPQVVARICSFMGK